MGLKTTLTILALMMVALISAPTTFAQYVAPPPQQLSKQLNLNKQVKHPENGQYVENLQFGDVRFLPEQEISFKIEVKNNGQTELTNIQVKDTLPNFLDFVSGPGNYDASSRTLNFTVDKLRQGESKSYEVKAKVKNAEELQANMATCITNFAEARVDELVSQDTAALCIESRVLGITRELPKTGSEGPILMLMLSFVTFAGSVFLYRQAKRVQIERNK
jgi:uncharacterized repeat protein (TIGR01451 family)/LPXTG-motif cell wall-anchored protein